ncbi:hybrid sensor histidine kinase/response regulator transcription factor [Spirosoma spitsbergense]|uniref:hybrid sensor histidine kinase/response regulator transcription factor n=1 Tax=Spirosoma spitsbergense TaxID=431554 RepID=UPI00037AC74C|nr:hybrid sensor histidine kinase/response regulator transcription factor [Spirosoma spitsbergense]
MVRPHLLLLLLFSPLLGSTQPAQPDRVYSNQSNEQSVANKFNHLSVENGLSNNSVICILQDREGYMWFGTNDGLNKYNGHTFTTFKPNLNDPAHSFQNNQIYHLCEDHANRLWVATLGGLHEVDKQTGRVTPHPIDAVNADKWNYQHSIYEDSQHILWVSTLGGLARYEPNLHRFTLFPVPEHEATLKTVFEDPQHRLWVATYEGLYLFDRVSSRFTLIPVQVAPGKAQPTFIAFYLDPKGVLWLGTSTAGYGLFRLDLHRQPWHLEPYYPAGQLSSYTYLNSICSDAEGMLWVATTGGLQRVDPVRNQAFTFRPDPDAPKGISSNNAQTVYIDRSGTLWVGTDNGIDRQAVNNKPFMTFQVQPSRGTANLSENKVVALLSDSKERFWLSSGYNVYRPATGGKHLQLIPPEVLGSGSQFKNFTQALLPDGNTGVWLGTWTGLYHFDEASGHFDNYPSEVPVEYMSCSHTGEIWVGGYIAPNSGIASFNPRTHQYHYYKYNPQSPQGLPDQYIHSLLISRTGDVWVPFRKNGIARLNPRTGRITHYVAGPKSGLNNNAIQTIYEDKAGIIWVGTQQGGLNWFKAKTGLFSAITTRDGLPSNNVVGIMNDKAGNLWLSTDNGLCRYDPRTKAVRNYQTVDGLPSNDFMQNAVFRQKDRLYFGSLNGVVYFNPDSIRDDIRPFPVYITELKVMEKPRLLTNSVITLNHDENFLSFEFAALSYTHPEKNQYAYQLVGVDKNWVQNGNRYVANYTSLSPGHYTFRVRAANSDGVWNRKGASVQLIIRPPWWATWWAYSLYALLMGGAIWAYIRFYTNRIRQRQELELNRRKAEQLKTVDELKTRFFSNITHEFRTPLSLIISPIDKLLQANRFDAPTRQTLALVQRNANQLLRLINQLLDLSKLEANRMDVSLMRGDVNFFVHQLMESFRPVADQKLISLTYTAEGLGQDEQLFDADKWEKILTNLLSNALKFTDSGGQVSVAVTTDLSLPSNGCFPVTIRITDSGIGISPENLPHIFDRFYQVDTSHTRVYEGTGIGLSLVKELVDLIGGTISVDSQPDTGSTFLLTLPIYPVAIHTEAPKAQLVGKSPALPATPVLATEGHQPTENEEIPLILIVEDNAELNGFLADSLTPAYRVMQATNGEEGWQLAQTELPNIVISDIMMPKMDGYELTHHIKNHPDTNHIAVVILSAKAAHSSRIEGLQEGADDYIAKPFHLDELLLRLRNIIFYQQKLRDQYRRQFTEPDTPSPINGVDDVFLQRTYDLLEKHLKDPSLTVDWLADELAMSRKTLYRKTHSLVQLNPHELIRQYRLRRATDLLRAGHNSSQTAVLTGFKNHSYFTTVFKEFYHKTPTEFASGDADNTQ